MSSPTPNLSFSKACENNKAPILSIIQPLFTGTETVLEVGSGTGQHALYFAENMPHLTWQCSDQPIYLPDIRTRLRQSKLTNTPAPLELNLFENQWPDINIDAVFCANAVHIMPWKGVEILFSSVGKALSPGGQLVLYGPFNYSGQYTSESNRKFDQWLKVQQPESAIRDFEAINKLAVEAGLTLIKDYEMPANNRILHWIKA